MIQPIRIILLIAGWIIFTTGQSMATEVVSPRFILDDLVGAALNDNPDIKAAEQRLRLYENKIIPAGALSDPSLSLAFNNYPADSFNDDEFAMSGKTVKLSQALPFPGKLAAKKEAAAQLASWYKGQLEDNKLQLVRQVKEAYYSYYYYNKAVGITEKNNQLLEDFTRLTETNYEVGQGLQQDVLKAQMERSKLVDRLYTLKQQRQTSLAALNRLTNRPPAHAVPLMPNFEITPVELPLEKLQAAPESNRPMYMAYQALVKSYQARQKLAKLDYRPDFKLGVAYTFREENRADDGTDFVGIEFSVNLPFSRPKRAAAVSEAVAGSRMALAQYNDFRNKVRFNIHDAYSRMQKNRDQALLYKSGIIPQSRQAFEAAMGSYQVGKVSFLVLLDNLKTVYNYEMEYFQVLANGERNIARLEAETGLSLTGKQITSSP